MIFNTSAYALGSEAFILLNATFTFLFIASRFLCAAMSALLTPVLTDLLYDTFPSPLPASPLGVTATAR